MNKKKIKTLSGMALVSLSVLALAACDQKDESKEEEQTKIKAEPVDIVSHKALYKIKLKSKTSDTKISDISGEMLFEWRQSCEAWITDHHFTINYQYIDAENAQITSDFSTYEMFTGDMMRFAAKRAHNDQVFQELRGTATINEITHEGEATYTKPEGLVIPMPKGSMFPADHTKKIIRMARQGKKLYEADVFDGSDEEGVIKISSFIGDKINVMANMEPNAGVDPSLINTPSWKVRMAFFPNQSEAAEAEYEMSAVLHDNGVISDMDIEYKEFAIEQELVALELVPEEICD